MATACDICGNRENEVKGGAGIEEKGTKITLKVTCPRDLNRDVLKVGIIVLNKYPINKYCIYSRTSRLIG